MIINIIIKRHEMRNSNWWPVVGALPLWAVKSYLDRGYVASRPIGPAGLTGRLFAAVPQRLSERPYLTEFVRLMRETCLLNLAGVMLL